MVLDEALRMHRQNWCVLPLKPQSKQPALRSWKRYQNQRPNEATVRNWFSGSTRKGLAVVLGPASDGLVCRDFDRMDAFERWAATHPDVAATLPQSETSRGRHVFCRVDSLAVQGVSQTGSSIVDYGDGELRGGGYAVLPPSIHESGRAYRWLIPPGEKIPCVNLMETGLAAVWAETRNHFTEETEEYGGQLKSTEATDESRSQGSRGALANGFDFSPIRDEIERAIVATLPTGPGRRNKAVFEFCRYLKGIPALSAVEPGELREIVLEWHLRALAFAQTTSPEETLADFFRGWPKVKFAADESPLRMLFDEALTEPLPHCCERYPTYEVKMLVALCRKLHHHWQPAPFPLACRNAGELLNVSHVTANGWLYLLTTDGVLKLEETGSQQKRRASRYRYTGD